MCLVSFNYNTFVKNVYINRGPGRTSRNIELFVVGSYRRACLHRHADFSRRRYSENGRRLIICVYPTGNLSSRWIQIENNIVFKANRARAEWRPERKPCPCRPPVRRTRRWSESSAVFPRSFIAASIRVFTIRTAFLLCDGKTKFEKHSLRVTKKMYIIVNHPTTYHVVFNVSVWHLFEINATKMREYWHLFPKIKYPIMDTNNKYGNDWLSN